MTREMFAALAEFALSKPGSLPGAAGTELKGFAAFVESAKPVIPLFALAPPLFVLWLLFGSSWRRADEESHHYRASLLARGTMDYRPIVALVLCALILTMQEYYGGRAYFDVAIRPLLVKLEAAHPAIHIAKYDELWGFSWWAGTRIFGYVLPFFLWPIFFRKDSVLDLGLRTRGFFDHVWIYFLYAAAVIPAMFIVAESPDFGAYYPFYKTASRSWFDFLAWEAMYFGQFFALEMFFRGFWLGSLRRSFGSGAIFVMIVPYCMIHYGKPYLEACGAIIAGVALGSIALMTRSIYQGFMVHITIAAMMDWMSLRHRKMTPVHLWPPEHPTPLAAFAAETARREELARTVERAAAGVFLALLAFAVWMMIRGWRTRSQRI